MWETSNDLLDAIYDAHDRLRKHETDAITAHAEARLLGSAVRALAVTLEHARLTCRLIEGSAALPGMLIEAPDSSRQAIDVQSRRAELPAVQG